MNIIQGIILGIVQGATEFIPVSSSAHLVLVPWVLRWPSPGLLFDTLLHWGTLAAVLAYFWRDWLAIIKGFFRSLGQVGPWNSAPGGRLADPNSRLAWAIILGTIPAVVVGFLFKDYVESLFNSPTAVGVFLIMTGVILAVSERFGRRIRALDRLVIADSLAIGLAQAAAIAPGISRSGATIAAGLGRGLTREAAARFSFLLGTPAILGAGILQSVDVLRASEAATSWPAALAGVITAAVVGYLCIKFLLVYLQRGSLYVFAAYCALLGLAVVILSLIG
jgi:undecaprenyl-diphosphatase